MMMLASTGCWAGRRSTSGRCGAACSCLAPSPGAIWALLLLLAAAAAAAVVSHTVAWRLLLSLRTRAGLRICVPDVLLGTAWAPARHCRRPPCSAASCPTAPWYAAASLDQRSTGSQMLLPAACVRAGGLPWPATSACWRWRWVPYPSCTPRPNGTKSWWRGKAAGCCFGPAGCLVGLGWEAWTELRHHSLPAGLAKILGKSESAAVCALARPRWVRRPKEMHLALLLCSLVAPPLAFANGFGAGVRTTKREPRGLQRGACFW